MKALYFEGAGWPGADISKATVGNCRIRTAFHLNDGRAVYFEASGCERFKKAPESIYRWKYTGFIDHCYYITDDKPNDDCNLHRAGLRDSIRSFEWSEDGILQVVNSLGAGFDSVKVLPDLGGYRVFPEENACGGPDGYYYGDEFVYDQELTRRREAVYRYYYKLEMQEGKQYPNFSLFVDEHDAGALHLIRHFDGYNRHWAIHVDGSGNLNEILSTAQIETYGEYGC